MFAITSFSCMPPRFGDAQTTNPGQIEKQGDAEKFRDSFHRMNVQIADTATKEQTRGLTVHQETRRGRDGKPKEYADITFDREGVPGSPTIHVQIKGDKALAMLKAANEPPHNLSEELIDRKAQAKFLQTSDQLVKAELTRQGNLQKMLDSSDPTLRNALRTDQEIQKAKFSDILNTQLMVEQRKDSNLFLVEALRVRALGKQAAKVSEAFENNVFKLQQQMSTDRAGS